jgi:hypothetical protein
MFVMIEKLNVARHAIGQACNGQVLFKELEHSARVAHPILNKIMVIKEMKTSLYKKGRNKCTSKYPNKTISGSHNVSV